MSFASALLSMWLASADGAQACARCHEKEHATWTTSRHARASLNSNFRVSHDRSPQRWCLTCHAPETGFPEEGVSCATCHLRNGVVRSSSVPTTKGLEAHPMVQDDALSTAQFCGHCHQFTLPQRVPFERDGTVVPSDFPAQQTLDEWEASPAAQEGVTCQECHMKLGSHAFPGGHDAELVRGALSVSLVLRGRSVGVTFSTSHVGHRVPTGDPFRRVRVTVCEDEPCTRGLGSVSLGRESEITPTGWRNLSDTRALPEARTRAEIRLRRAPSRPLYYRVTYHLNDPMLDRSLTGDAVAYELFRGVVAPPSTEPP